jgi:predicted transcriptional regulator
MNLTPEEIAGSFFEISSELRVSVLFSLRNKPSSLSNLAKEIDVTAPELHRNLARLQKADLIRKDADGNYHLTLYGKTVCEQIPVFDFMLKNKKYFEGHDFADLPTKYVQRIGALSESDLIVGYVKVIDQWESIYRNAKEYISNILIETPYNEKLLKTLEGKLSNNIKISSIFSESAIISKDRQELLCKFNFSKFVKEGLLERKMKKDVKVAVVLNEKEAGVIFPTREGEPDLSKMFYSSDGSFHEWCFDFFSECWKSSTSFQETKLMQH